LSHPADHVWHLFAAEQEATKEDGQQHSQAAQQVSHSCGGCGGSYCHVHGSTNLADEMHAFEAGMSI